MVDGDGVLLVRAGLLVHQATATATVCSELQNGGARRMRSGERDRRVNGGRRGRGLPPNGGRRAADGDGERRQDWVAWRRLVARRCELPCPGSCNGPGKEAGPLYSRDL